jgi:hypothetical protein
VCRPGWTYQTGPATEAPEIEAPVEPEPAYAASVDSTG